MNLKPFLPIISCITGMVISCGGSDSSTNPDENADGPLPESALSSGCFNWPAPNCAFLIRQDGILDTVQQWVDVDEMEAAINALLGSAASGNF